jgi:hypothetical protein
MDNSLTQRAAAEVNDFRQTLFAVPGSQYLFVDPLFQDPLEAFTDSLRVPMLKHYLDLTEIGLEKRRTPYFVRLISSSDTLFDFSFQLAQANAQETNEHRSLCAWFVSHLSNKELASYFKEIFLRKLSATRAKLFRFFDPAVASHIPRIFAKTHQVKPLVHWYCIAQDLAITDFDLARVPLGKNEWSSNINAALERLSLVTQTFAMIQSELADENWELVIQRIDQALTRAIALGLKVQQEADCITLAAHMCVIDSDLPEEKTVKSWIDLAVSQKKSYVDSAAQAEPDVWSEIESLQWKQARN